MNRLRHALHILFPIWGALRYGVPGHRMRLIGVTGTDGKSSTVLLAASMLRAAGHRVAHYSSISTHDGGTERLNDRKMTMPGRAKLHRFLKEAADSGATHAVIEVTSEGIRQSRHRMLGFETIAITNITPEHIESHGSFAKYRAAKLSLFRNLRGERAAIIPESLAEELMPYTRGLHVHTVGGAHSSVRAEEISGALTETRARLVRDEERTDIASSLGGPFALTNMLMAAGIASVYGVPLPRIKEAIEGTHVIPGRFEILSTAPLVIVDYAHTLEALTTLLPYMRAHVSGKLIHVFGAAGGGRDRYKRPLIGKLSEQSADLSVVTEENPFDEGSAAIAADIVRGFERPASALVVLPREEAARQALSMAGPNDAVLLTGKGSETRIAGPQGSYRPYNEREYVRCLLETS